MSHPNFKRVATQKSATFSANFVEGLQSDTTALRNDVDQLKPDFQDLTVTVNVLNATQLDQETDIQGLQSDTTALRNDVDQLKPDFQDLTVTVDVLNATQLDQETDIQGLQSDATTLKDDVLQQTSELQTLTVSLNALNATTVEQETDIQNLQSDVNNLQSSETRQDTDLQDLTATVDKVNSTVFGQAEDLMYIQSDVNNLKSSETQQDTDLQELTMSVDTINSTVQGQAAELENLNDDVKDLNTTVQDLADVQFSGILSKKSKELNQKTSEADFRNDSRKQLSASQITMDYLAEQLSAVKADVRQILYLLTEGRKKVATAQNAHCNKAFVGDLAFGVKIERVSLAEAEKRASNRQALARNLWNALLPKSIQALSSDY
ncbi:chromosome partition protein Smc-like [Corticium candelabrum]|uniref:chromosome partition protein Smc-like n=1 Tax=Corticium candelabrum TaxID=121492 RepID=UPI002E2674E8|nr:chromosome partition protein Smc-like [Corticium candelabrum]